MVRDLQTYGGQAREHNQTSQDQDETFRELVLPVFARDPKHHARKPHGIKEGR
ncbi:MAG TPA: hypothetical protein VFT74_01410 [Isosphaeraceae bacterium]|nr:hypothetical protein [Isosphaeraceae bacterium]